MSVNYILRINKSSDFAEPDDFIDSSSMLVNDNGKINVVIAAISDPNKPGLVGIMRLCETKYGFYESHVSIKPEYCGIGLGAKLYLNTISYALNNGIAEVRSSDNPSFMAKRAWEGKLLNAHFLIKKEGLRYRVIGRKEVGFKLKCLNYLKKIRQYMIQIF